MTTGHIAAPQDECRRGKSTISQCLKKHNFTKKMLVGAASNQCDCNGAVSASMEMMIKAVLPAFQSSYLQYFCKTFLNIKQIVFQSRPLAFRQRCRHINKCQKKKLFVDKIHCRRPWKRGLICTVVRCLS